jgi:hypothetical protein
MWPLILAAAAVFAIYTWKKSLPPSSSGRCLPTTALQPGHLYTFGMAVPGAPYANPSAYAQTVAGQLQALGVWQNINVSVWGDPSATAFAWPPPAPQAGTAVVVSAQYTGQPASIPPAYIGPLDCGGGASPGS